MPWQDNAVARQRRGKTLYVCPVNYTTIHYAHTMVHMYARALGLCMPSVTGGIRPYAPRQGSLLEDAGVPSRRTAAVRSYTQLADGRTRRSAAPAALAPPHAAAADSRSPAPPRRRFSLWAPRQESAHCSYAAAERPLRLSELRSVDVGGRRSRSDR